MDAAVFEQVYEAFGYFHAYFGPPVSRAPRLSGALPGNTSTAGNQLRVSVHHNRRLVPVEAPAAALVAMAHLRVVDRHHPAPAHPVLEAHSVIRSAPRPPFGAGGRLWSSNCPSSSAAATIRCRSSLSPGNSPCACRDNSNNRSASAAIPASSAARACRSDQSMAGLALHAGAQVSLISPGLAHSLTGACSTAASARNYLTIPSANRLQVSLINSPTRPNESMPMGLRLQHYIMLRDLNVMDSKEFL